MAACFCYPKHCRDGAVGRANIQLSVSISTTTDQRSDCSTANRLIQVEMSHVLGESLSKECLLSQETLHAKEPSLLNGHEHQVYLS